VLRHDRVSRRASSKAIYVGLALSLMAAAWMLSRVGFSDLAEGLRRAETAWLVPSGALLFVVLALRAQRWAVLLGRTPFTKTWHAYIIGYFFNMTLPLRVGEVARAYVISKTSAVTMARALSAVVVERLLDLATVVSLFFWFAQRIPMRPAFTRAAAIGAVAFILCVVAGVVFLSKGQAVLARIGPRLEKRFGDKRGAALTAKIEQLRQALQNVGTPARFIESLVLTALIWITTIVLSAVCLRAFLPGGIDLTKAGLVVVMANLGGALPSAPGGMGIVQGFATSALVIPFGIPEGIALAFALVWSLGQTLMLIALGFVSLGRVGLSFREIREQSHSPGESTIG
jgi:glycosyltransferase 2 family protein